MVEERAAFPSLHRSESTLKEFERMEEFDQFQELHEHVVGKRVLRNCWLVFTSVIGEVLSFRDETIEMGNFACRIHYLSNNYQ